MKLHEKILDGYCKGIRRYGDLMRYAFPDDKSWRYSANGGPPGCAMAFGNAMRRAGLFTTGVGFDRPVYKTVKVRQKGGA